MEGFPSAAHNPGFQACLYEMVMACLFFDKRKRIAADVFFLAAEVFPKAVFFYGSEAATKI